MSLLDTVQKRRLIFSVTWYESAIFASNFWKNVSTKVNKYDQAEDRHVIVSDWRGMA